MKSIIKRILVVVAIVLVLAAFTSCEESIIDLTNKINDTRCEWFDHKFVVTGDVPATCLEPGMTGESVCEICGYVEFTNTVIEPTGHAWTDATCAAPKTCDNCKLTEGERLEHVMVDVESKESTCAEPGYTAHRACENCEYTENKEFFDLLEHSYVDFEGKKPTCTEGGYSAHQVCTECGYINGKEILEPAHSFVEIEGKESTCTKAGYSAHKVCVVCGRIDGREDYELVAHSWGEADENGAITCTVCGTAKPTDEDNGSTEDNNGTTEDNTGSTEDNTGSTEDNTGSTEDNTGSNEE